MAETTIFVTFIIKCETLLESALRSLKLVSSSEYSIGESRGWYRGGEETYIYEFWISEFAEKQGYILKACVTPALGVGIDEIIEIWIKRRILLSENNVAVPRLHGHGNGLILEELIPYSIQEVLTQSTTPLTLLDEVGFIAGVLSRLGFSPTSLIGSLRSRGNDVVFVDFGQDLGEEGVLTWSTDSLFNFVIEELKKIRVVVSEKTTESMYDHFLLAKYLGIS